MVIQPLTWSTAGGKSTPLRLPLPASFARRTSTLITVASRARYISMAASSNAAPRSAAPTAASARKRNAYREYINAA